MIVGADSRTLQQKQAVEHYADAAGLDCAAAIAAAQSDLPQARMWTNALPLLARDDELLCAEKLAQIQNSTALANEDMQEAIKAMNNPQAALHEAETLAQQVAIAAFWGGEITGPRSAGAKVSGTARAGACSAATGASRSPSRSKQRADCAVL